MRIVIQRVTKASVTIDGKLTSGINQGLVLLVGIEDADSREDIDWLVRKCVNLRIFDDNNGVMNLSLLDVKGEALIVSQFTLQASIRKGNRPSYYKASGPGIAIPLYEQFIHVFSRALGREVKTGEFGADMAVELINDGPVTIVVDSQHKDF